MLPRRAQDTLRILIHLRTVVLFHGILVLRLDEPATNRNGVQFVGADTSI